MQKIHKLLILNTLTLIVFIIVFCVYYDKTYTHYDIITILYFGIVLMQRACILRSDSSLFISLVLLTVCVIILLLRFEILNTSNYYGYLMDAIAFSCIVVYLIFNKHMMCNFALLLAPCGLIVTLYTNQLLNLIWCILTCIISVIVGVCIIRYLINYRRHNDKV